MKKLFFRSHNLVLFYWKVILINAHECFLAHASHCSKSFTLRHVADIKRYQCVEKHIYIYLYFSDFTNRSDEKSSPEYSQTLIIISGIVALFVCITVLTCIIRRPRASCKYLNQFKINVFVIASTGSIF